MATRTKRVEMRTDPDRERLIAQAAALQRKSVSSFVLDAAAAEAERVVGQADVTRMPAAQFDAFVAALDEPTPLPKLAEAARAGRRFTRA